MSRVTSSVLIRALAMASGGMPMSTVLLPITLVSAGAMALINVWLGYRVGQVRTSEKVSVGDGGNGRSIVCDPSGRVLHQSGAGAEIVPIEVDFGLVRRERERGVLSNLGQPLKSFRDRECEFDVYRRDSGRGHYLATLGPLIKPD